MLSWCCSCCKESTTEVQEDDSGTQRLIANDFNAYGSVQSIEPEQPSLKEDVVASNGDVATIMTDIIKGVENQVVDAGTNDVNILEQQDYAARTNYYAEQFSDRFPLPASGLGIPNATGRPSAILAALTTSVAEIDEVKSIARRTADLIAEMCPRERYDLIVQFDST